MVDIHFVEFVFDIHMKEDTYLYISSSSSFVWNDSERVDVESNLITEHSVFIDILTWFRQ